MLLTLWLLAVCFMRRGFMRPADCAALMNIHLFLAGCIGSLLCRLLAHGWESPGFAAHRATGWMCMWLWFSPAELYHLRSCFTLTLRFLLLTLPWLCPPAAVWESCCLPSPSLECLREGVCYFRLKRSYWVCKWWNFLKRKPYAIWDSYRSLRACWKLGTVQILAYSCGFWWQNSLLVPRGACLIRSWSFDLEASLKSSLKYK